MIELDDVPVADLQRTLDTVGEKRPALRLVVALNYKHGLTQTEIAEQYGIARKTVYNWLSRFESRSIDAAIYDDDRSGRPPKFSEAQRRSFEALLQQPPESVGYDEAAWTPALVQRLVTETFDVEYSVPHLRRLMREAGLAPADEGWRPTDDQH